MIKKYCRKKFNKLFHIPFGGDFMRLLKENKNYIRFLINYVNIYVLINQVCK